MDSPRSGEDSDEDDVVFSYTVIEKDADGHGSR